MQIGTEATPKPRRSDATKGLCQDGMIRVPRAVAGLRGIAKTARLMVESDLLVYLAMRDLADRRTHRVILNTSLIAHRAGVSVRSVQRVLKDGLLYEMGLLKPTDLWHTAIVTNPTKRSGGWLSVPRAALWREDDASLAMPGFAAHTLLALLASGEWRQEGTTVTVDVAGTRKELAGDLVAINRFERGLQHLDALPWLVIERTHRKPREFPIGTTLADAEALDDTGWITSVLREWHPTYNYPLTPQRVTISSGERPWWRCAKGHEWQVWMHARSIRRSSCPACSPAGTSRIEVEFRRKFAQSSVLTLVENGGVPHRVPVSGLPTRSVQVDILGVLACGRKVAIEYDGSYWHGDNSPKKGGACERDIAVTHALLNAGYLVVRIREMSQGYGLFWLNIQNPDILQVSHEYDSTYSNVPETIQDIEAWLASHTRS